MNPIRTLVIVVSMLLFGLGAAACKKPQYPACKKDKHCKVDLGEKCVDGNCQNCTTDADCAGKGAATTCHEFRCQDPATIDAGGAGAGGSELGGPCTQTLDCNGGWVCTEGACSQCTDDIQCSPSTCNLDTGRCAAGGQCQTDDQCPMDEICDGGMCIFSGTNPTGTGPCGLDAVYFAFDSDQLTPKNQEDLKGLASCIAENGQQVYLEAHADNVGTEEYNILLTEKRGESVKGFLETNGAPADLLQVIAKGNLEATGSTESERAKDRRVQFVWP